MGRMTMAGAASNHSVQVPLSPSLGLQLAGFSRITAGRSPRYSRLPAARSVRFGTEVVDLDEGGGAGDGTGTDGITRTPVASATLDAAYRRCNYRVTAWQPQGKPAFVFLISVGERKFLQPNVSEGADFDEVMQNAATFVEQMLDEEEE